MAKAKIKILFFVANATGTSPLKLDEEIRAIDARIRSSEFGDELELVSAWATRPDDLQQKLLEHKPHIARFPSDEEMVYDYLEHHKDPEWLATYRTVFSLKDRFDDQGIWTQDGYLSPPGDLRAILDSSFSLASAVYPASYLDHTRRVVLVLFDGRLPA